MAFGGIGELLKLGYGIYQTTAAADTLNTTQRPTYQRPGQISTLEAIARTQYGDPTFAGQGAAQDRLDQSAANAYQQGASAGNPFAAIAGIQAGQQAGQLDIQTMANQQQRQDLANYQQALQIGAQYKDAEFQMNEFAPYADAIQQATDQLGAGTKNIYGGVSGLGSVASALSNSALEGANSQQVGDTSAIYNQYNQNSNAGGLNEGMVSDYLSGNINNPNANMPGKTWNQQLQMWI